MLKKTIQTPYKLRNKRDTVKSLSSSSNFSSSNSGSIGLPRWLEFVDYDEENESIKFSKHLLSEGEIAAYQEGEFNTNIFDNIPTGSKSNKGLLQVGNGINVNNGVISLDSSAITPQTLSFSNNVLSISKGNFVDLSTLQTDLSDYYTKTQTDTLLSGKANKNGSSTEDFTVKNLTLHGTVNHWLADVITVADARLQLNRTQEGATVESGIDICNGSSVVSSLNYTTDGNWQFTNGDIYQGGTKVALQNVSINAGNGLTGGGAISANRTITLGTPSTITNSTTNSVSSTSHTHAIDLRHLNRSYNYLDVNGLAVSYDSNSSNPGGSWAYNLMAHTSDNSIERKGFTLSVPHNSDALYVRGTGASAIGANSANNYFGTWRRIYTDNYHPDADNATNLGGYSASSYPRKAEDASITGLWSIYRAGADTTLLRFGTERPWQFRQVREGASAGLSLVSETGSKSFDIRNTQGVRAADFFVGETSSRVLLVPDGGNVGIGLDTTPTERLHVAGNGLFTGNLTAGGNITVGSTGRLILSQSNTYLTGGGHCVLRANGIDYWRAEGTNNIFRIYQNTIAEGNITVGSTSTAANRVVRILTNDSYAAGFEAYGNSQGTGYLYVGQSSTYGGGIEYNGDNNPVTTGAGSDYIALYRRNNGVDYWTARNKQDNNNWEFRGNITAQGEVTAYSSSDRRLKSNITPITSSLSIIDKINPVTFNWNDKAVKLNNTKNTSSKNYGVIAQEIEEVLPDLVHETNGYKSVDYIQLIGVLLSAVKELNNKIKNLEIK